MLDAMERRMIQAATSEARHDEAVQRQAAYAMGKVIATEPKPRMSSAAARYWRGSSSSSGSPSSSGSSGSSITPSRRTPREQSATRRKRALAASRRSLSPAHPRSLQQDEPSQREEAISWTAEQRRRLRRTASNARRSPTTRTFLEQPFAGLLEWSGPIVIRLSFPFSQARMIERGDQCFSPNFWICYDQATRTFSLRAPQKLGGVRGRRVVGEDCGDLRGASLFSFVLVGATKATDVAHDGVTVSLRGDSVCACIGGLSHYRVFP